MRDCAVNTLANLPSRGYPSRMLATMAAPKKSPTTKKPAATTGRRGSDALPSHRTTAVPKERKKSKLTAAREEASRLAGRTVLLATCEALKWNLTRVAETLEMATGADVIRALKELAPEEYEAAQQRGDIARRRPDAT